MAARRQVLERAAWALEQRLNAATSDHIGPELSCTCGAMAQYCGRHRKTFTSALGLLHLERAYYHCARCQSGFCPRDRALGLESFSLTPGYSLTAASYMAQDDIARMTGGEAVYSSNDLVGSLEKVTEDEGSYYTLSYSPSNRNFDGQLRQIRVRLEEGGYRLSYRRAYYGLSTQDVDVPAGDTLSASMKHGAPEGHQLVFMARVTPTGSPAPGTRNEMRDLEEAETGKVTTRPLKPIPLQLYAIGYTLPAEQLRPQSGAAPQFEMAAVVYDADGRLLNSVTNRTIETDSPASEQPASQKAFRMEPQLDAPLDARFMRLAVRDLRTDKIGSMETPLPLVPEK